MTNLEKLLSPTPTDEEYQIGLESGRSTDQALIITDALAAHRVATARAALELAATLNCPYCCNGLPREVDVSRDEDDGDEWIEYYVHHGDVALRHRRACGSATFWETLAAHNASVAEEEGK